MNFKKFTAYSMSAIMVTSLVSGCSSDASDNDTSKKTDTEKDKKSSITANMATGSGFGTKKETVYVTTGSDGTVSDITVSEWLKNPKKYATLKDVTPLSDILNVKGDEEFTTSGGEIAFDTNGNDIYYQGKLANDTILPVSLSIKYELDGKEISGDQLNGKSGRLKMTINYNANLKNRDDIYVPFLAATGMLLPTDNFTNINVTNGTVISNGNYDMVVGMGIPGITSSLSSLSENLPTSVEMTADVKDFHMGSMMTVVTNKSLGEIDLSEFDDLDNIPDMIEKLSSSSTGLKDGANALFEGLSALNSSTPALSDGVTALDTGALDLKNGANKLKNGTSDLKAGAKELDDGLYSLKNGISGTNGLSDGLDKLADGITDKENGLNAGIDKLADGVNGKNGLVNGIQQLYDGITDKDTGLEAGINQLYKGITDNKSGLNAGINQIYDGITDKDTGLNAGAKKIEGAVKTIASTVNTMLLPYSKQLNTGVHTLTATIRSMETVLSSLNEKYVTLSTTLAENEKNIAKLEALATSQPLTETQLATLKKLYQAQGQKTALEAVISGLPSSLADTEKLNASLDGLDKLADGIEQLATGLDNGLTTNKESNLTDAMKSLSSGTDKLASGITQLKAGSDKLYDGITKIKAGTSKLANGITQLNTGAGTLSNGIIALQKGSDKLVTGVTALQSGVSTLSNGANALKDGSKSLYEGSKTLADGTSELYTGTVQLKSGTSELKNKVPELTDGVTKLYNGSKQLSDGAAKFDKDGIQKIVDAYEDNYKVALDEIKSSFEAGKEYTTLTGDGEGTAGTTTFIINTKY